MRLSHLFSSLRFKITAGIALPLLVILGAFSTLQYIRQRDLLLSNLDHATTNIGNVIVGSLQHAMLSQDLPEIQGIMDNIAKQEGIRTVFLMNTRSEVRFAPGKQGVGHILARSDAGCVECHGPDVSVHLLSTIFVNSQGERVFRNCKPIVNLPECQACHGTASPYNGVLVTDVSMRAVDESLANDLRTNILWSAATILATILVVNALMNRMVVTRVERMASAIKAFSRGDLGSRMHVQSGDELGELAESFNRMTAQVLDHTRELERLNEELRRKEMLRGQLLDKVITAQEEERKRVARDLHDQLGTALSAMTMGMQAAERALPPEMQALRDRLQHAKELATRALEQTHELILDLRPVALDDLGLSAAVRSYAEEHLTPRGIEVQVIVSGTPRRLAPELEITLFRILQEAINNIANHADAQHITLSLEFRADRVEAVLRDDGRGFDPASVLEPDQAGRGLGLLGMQERATLADGTFRVESQPGGGTTLTIRLPA